MGRTHDAIDSRLETFLLAQPVFFVATAPLSGDGHVSCSPKSNNGELAVFGGHTIAYLDRTGSGVETIAHLRENGRTVLMFCAFQGAPRIVRLHGRGRAVWREHESFAGLAARFKADSLTGARAVVVVDVDRIADSCGFGVPLMTFTSHRRELVGWADRKGEDGLVAYQREHNSLSLDGLRATEGVSES